MKPVVTPLGLLVSAIFFIEQSTLPGRLRHTTAVTSDKRSKNHQQVREEFSLSLSFPSRWRDLCIFIVLGKSVINAF